ncbi:MAG TPA: peptidase, partial [Anaerolineae bacterium]|nr:peptidase [Anaerolineae bacterium]
MGKTIEERIAQFVPTELTFDQSLLGERDRQVLGKIVEASRFMDEIFLRQVSPRNPEWLAQLESSDRAEDRDLLHYFRIMYGPWDRLEEHGPFMGEEKKPLGAGFYPADLTKGEFEAWLARHPEEEQAFASYYTVIKGEGDQLVAVPYSEAYQEFLEPAARLLEEAAEASDNASLSRFLRSRAEAF